MTPEPGSAAQSTPRPSVPGSLAAVLGRFGGTQHGGDTGKAMVLPANFYSDTAILRREINRCVACVVWCPCMTSTLVFHWMTSLFTVAVLPLCHHHRRERAQE